MTSPDLLKREFWQAFAPQLHIVDIEGLQRHPPVLMTTAQQEVAAAQVRHEGYLQASIQWGLDLRPMVNAVRSLSNADLSPAFAIVYDEFWIPYYRLHFMLSGLLGDGYRLLPDFWVWNIDPKKGGAGWTPHRDKGRRALFPDGSPKAVTVWIPLSPATPLNSCMYIVPAMHDPTYGTEDEKIWKFDYPSIRALPAQPGDFFIWNQAVLHWGSKSSTQGQESRISMAVEFQRGDIEPFNQPLIEPLKLLTFEARLKLVARQILQYKHMYSLSPSMERLAWSIL